MPSHETIETLVQTLFASIRAMDIDAWLGLFAEDATNLDPVGAPPAIGHAAIRQMLEGLTQAFASANLTPEGIFVAGNEVAVKWTAHCVAKNGVSVHFEGVDVIEVNESGKIQSLKAYWNPAAVMAQIQAP